MVQGGSFCTLLATAFVVSNILLAVLIPVYGASGRFLAVMAWIIACYHGWLYVHALRGWLSSVYTAVRGRTTSRSNCCAT
jgi:hypothetical protein